MRHLAVLLILLLVALPVYSETNNADAAEKDKSVKAVLPAGSIGAGPVKAAGGGRIFAGEKVLLTATVYDIKGAPQQNRRIDFSVENSGGENAPKLGKSTGITDKNGNVSVELATGANPGELNLVRATAPGIKNHDANSVLFKIKAWMNPLQRLAANYAKTADLSAVRIDSGVSGGKELPESRMFYLAKKPDMSKSVSAANSSSYTVFKAGVACSFAAGREPLKKDISGIMGLPYAQVNYQYATESFLAAHEVRIRLCEKPGFPELYSVEAVPVAENKSYSRIIIYVDYLTGLDVEVERYGVDKTLASRSVIKRASQFEVPGRNRTGRVYESGKPYEPFAVSGGDGAEFPGCWIPEETEAITYFGSENTVIKTRFEDIKINTGIGDSEFVIP